MEFTLLIAAGIAVGAACGASRWSGRSDCDLIAGAVVAGIATGRLWAMISSGTNPLAHPLDVLIVRGGVDPFAAAAGALAAAAWASRADLLPNLDALAFPALSGLAAWHAACLVRGTCLGTVTELPWGWGAGGGGDRHPVELYAALLFGVAAVVAVTAWRRSNHRHPGVLAALSLAAAAAIRSATEPMRPVIGGGLEMTYAITAAVAVVIGLTLLLGCPQRRSELRAES